jgi:hypothetical protein
MTDSKETGLEITSDNAAGTDKGDGGDSDITVGFRRPPKAKRFNKGQSGNPKGRPKGARNLRTELNAELNERITAIEHGIPRPMTKRRAVIKAQVAQSIKGKTQAAQFLWNLERTPDRQGTAAPASEPSREDLEIVEGFLKRQHKGRYQP